MEAGMLDQLITLERMVTAHDPKFNTPVISWVPIPRGTMWANMKDVQPSRSEAVKQGLTVARRQTVITVRYMYGIDSSMHVVWNDGVADVVFQIVGGPAMVGHRQWIEMMVERYSS